MLTSLAYYVHNLNPIIFSLGPIQPRWYGFAYLMGFLGAYILIQKLSRDGMLRLAPDKVPDLVLNGCIFGVLIGGRVGYVLFYDLPNSLAHHETPLLWSFSNSFPFWGLLRVMDGGMSAHGGVIFTILTLLWFARKYKVSVINIGDAACMVVPIGLFFGRIANFINGELYGHPSTVPWAVKFPSEIYAPTNGSILSSVDAQLPSVYAKILPGYPAGFNSDDAYQQLCRLLQQHSQTAVNAVADILPARHPSQLYEAMLEGSFCSLSVGPLGVYGRKDGMASGAFLTRSIFRSCGSLGNSFGSEMRRLWRGALTLLSSAGVIYSLAMFIPGVIYWIFYG